MWLKWIEIFRDDSKNDVIFLIIRLLPQGQYGHPLRVYEKVEEKGIIKWSFVANFGLKDYDATSFPPVIQPITDRKFYFFPEEIRTLYTSDLKINFNLLQLWNKNNTLTRSSLKFPTDTRQEIEYTTYTWILQV